MKESDLDQVYALYNKQMTQMDLHQIFTREEAAHFLLPKHLALYSFVVEDPSTNKITAFVNFNVVDNNVSGNSLHTSMTAGYLWLYACQDDEQLSRMVSDAMIKAKEVNYYSFNS